MPSALSQVMNTGTAPPVKDLANSLLAARAAAQQQKELRQRGSRGSLVAAKREEHFVAKDDEYGVHAIRLQKPPETVTVLSAQFDEWALWDFGSGLTTCGSKDSGVVWMTIPKTLL